MTPPIRGIYNIVQFKELPSGTVAARCWGRGRAEPLISKHKQHDAAPERAWATLHLVDSMRYLHCARSPVLCTSICEGGRSHVKDCHQDKYIILKFKYRWPFRA